MSAGSLSTGLTVSVMVTVTIPIIAFPLASLAVQVTFVVPKGNFAVMLSPEVIGSRSPNPGASVVRVTGNSSSTSGTSSSTGVARAVASLVRCKDPSNFSTGCVVSTTVIFCTPVVSLPFLSLAVQVTVVVPSA
ncbi:hypothetical protein D3C75_789950 [compost metagenome]